MERILLILASLILAAPLVALTDKAADTAPPGPLALARHWAGKNKKTIAVIKELEANARVKGRRIVWAQGDGLSQSDFATGDVGISKRILTLPHPLANVMKLVRHELSRQPLDPKLDRQTPEKDWVIDHLEPAIDEEIDVRLGDLNFDDRLVRDAIVPRRELSEDKLDEILRGILDDYELSPGERRDKMRAVLSAYDGRYYEKQAMESLKQTYVAKYTQLDADELKAKLSKSSMNAEEAKAAWTAAVKPSFLYRRISRDPEKVRDYQKQILSLLEHGDEPIKPESHLAANIAHLRAIGP